jgi:hypothetical protein
MICSRGGLGHFSRAFTAESIQDGKLIEAHVPDDRRPQDRGGHSEGVFFFSCPAHGRGKGLHSLFELLWGEPPKKEVVRVLLPLPAARLAPKAWAAATKPAHLARAAGGCLGFFRDVPIEVEGGGLFDYMALPGSSR